jgi:hypothetical protein
MKLVYSIIAWWRIQTDGYHFYGGYLKVQIQNNIILANNISSRIDGRTKHHRQRDSLLVSSASARHRGSWRPIWEVSRRCNRRYQVKAKVSLSKSFFAHFYAN